MSLVKIIHNKEEVLKGDDILTITSKLTIKTIPDKLKTLLDAVTKITNKDNQTICLSAARRITEFEKTSELTDVDKELFSVFAAAFDNDYILESILDDADSTNLFAYTVLAFFPLVDDDSHVNIHLTNIQLSGKKLSFDVLIRPFTEDEEKIFKEWTDAREAQWAANRLARQERDDKITNAVIEKMYEVGVVKKDEISLENFRTHLIESMKENAALTGFSDIPAMLTRASIRARYADMPERK